MTTATDLVAAAEAAQEPLDAFEGQEITPGLWHPTDEREANRALGYVAESEAAVLSAKAQLDDLIATLTARFDAVVAPHIRRAEFYRRGLEQYAEENKRTLLIGKAKSRQFIAGRIAWRRKPGRLVVTDKEALQAWLSTQDPSLFRVALSPEMKALQEKFNRDGVIPPGTEFQPERDELSIEAEQFPTLPAPAKELP
jgi:phage host-nuclease inhibitor protein Gam